MPAYVEIYSADMRTALFHATIDREMSVQGALRAAAAGELEGLSTEDQRTLGGIAYAYACELVREEKLRRGAVKKVRDDAVEVAKQLAARLLALADREVQRIERGKLKDPVDTGRATAAAKLAREALALTRDATLEPKTAAKTTTDKTAPTQRPRTLAAVIAADSGPAADDDPQDNDARGESATPRDGANERKTNDESAGPVRSCAA